MPSLIDVVIPTATFGNRVEGLLDDLSRELRPFAAQVGRIVVVDDQAVRDVRGTLLGDGAIDVDAWPSEANGPAVNRNRGAKDARSSWLVFLDDDVRLLPGWGTATTALLDGSGRASIIGGGIRSQRPRNWFSQAAEDFVVRHREYPEGWYLAAAHLFVRTSVFAELGGFDTRYAYGAEDWDFCRRAHARGFAVRTVDEPAVAHANPTTWRQLRRKAEQYGKANATFDRSMTPPGGASQDSPSPEATTQASGSNLPSPMRGARWAGAEYRLLRASGRGRLRSFRSVGLYIPWMAVYLRSQALALKASR